MRHHTMKTRFTETDKFLRRRGLPSAATEQEPRGCYSLRRILRMHGSTVFKNLSVGRLLIKAVIHYTRSQISWRSLYQNPPFIIKWDRTLCLFSSSADLLSVTDIITGTSQSCQRPVSESRKRN